MNENDDNDLVLSDFACPHCYEQRADWLIVRDDDSIECATCGTVYRLDAGAAVEDKPHLCHCGAPLDDGACECEVCAAEFQDWLDDASTSLYNL